MPASASTTPRTPSRGRRESNPFGLSLDLRLGGEEPLRQNAKLDVASQLKLAAQPRMEIVAMAPRQSYVHVHSECDFDSPLVDIQLKRGTRLRVLETRKLPELQMKRARIVLLADSTPLGWITLSAENGDCPTVRPIYARPLYVVVNPPLVRRRFEKGSRAVCMLPIGTKLHLVDSRRDADGGQRVCIVLLGQDEPLGWITAKRPQKGWLSIREVAEDDPFLFSPGASPPNSRPPSARSRSKSPRGFDRWFSSSPREQGHANFALAIAQARAKNKWRETSPPSSPQATPRKSPLPSPRVSPRPSIFNRDAILKDRAAVAAIAEASAAAAELAEKSLASGGSPIRSGADSGRRVSSAGSTPNKVRRKKSTTDDASAPLLTSALLEAAIADCKEKVEAGQALIDPSKKTLTTIIGEAIVASGMKAQQLVQTWAKRGSEPLNKIDFRTHVRKLLDEYKPDSKQIDALFETLDDDKGGTLDLAEIQRALKKMQDAASVAARYAAGIEEKIERITSLESLAKVALDATVVTEQTTVTLEQLGTNKSVSARLGAQVVSKRMKVVDVIQKWDANGDGVLDKGEFRQNVKSLGVNAESTEIDELFDELASGGKALTIPLLRNALKVVTDDAAATDKRIRDLQFELVEQTKTARATQQTYKKRQKEEEVLAQAAEEAAAKENEEKAAIAAEAQAKRMAEQAEKKAAALAAKAEFDRKVRDKRQSRESYENGG